METKTKSGAPKATPKSEKKEPAPRKPDPAPADPAPADPAPPQDGAAAEQEAGPEGGEGAAAAGTDCLESLKPFLIGGAAIAAGAAVLIAVVLLARRN